VIVIKRKNKASNTQCKDFAMLEFEYFSILHHLITITRRFHSFKCSQSCHSGSITLNKKDDKIRHYENDDKEDADHRSNEFI